MLNIINSRKIKVMALQRRQEMRKYCIIDIEGGAINEIMIGKVIAKKGTGFTANVCPANPSKLQDNLLPKEISFARRLSGTYLD